MRVLMVSDVYFPRINGVSTSIETFRQALAAHGVSVRLVVPRYGDEEAQPEVWRVPGRPVPGDPEDRLPDWRAMHATVREAAHGCDLIHIHTPFVAHYAGVAAGRRLGLPVVATYHTLFEEYVTHYGGWLARLLPVRWLKAAARAASRHQCNQLAAMIVPSQAMRERLLAYGVKVPLQVVPTGIPLARFAGGDGPAFRARHGLAPGRRVALYVGRVAHEKNIGFLLAAWPTVRRECPEAVLLIAGEGPALPALRAQVARQHLGDQVRFVGYLDRQHELPDCYAAADVFAFASQTETQGLVLLEAMAAGLPVVALAEMGTADILAAGRGCLVPPADPEVFGVTLGHLLARPEVWGYLGAEAAQAAREWSDQAQAARLAEWYRSLMVPALPAVAPTAPASVPAPRG